MNFTMQSRDPLASDAEKALSWVTGRFADTNLWSFSQSVCGLVKLWTEQLLDWSVFVNWSIRGDTHSK